MFLLNGLDPGNVNSKRGWPLTYPLHEAVKQNDAHITSKLLVFGADLQAKDVWGRIAYQCAGCREEHLQVRQILERYAAYRVSPHQPRLGRPRSQYCPPPRGFEEFFAQLETDPLVQGPRAEGEWLLIHGPLELRTRIG